MVVDYTEMRYNDLRALCKERGIAYPNGSKKADLVEMLERADLASPIEVEAVAVEDEIIPANALMIDGKALQAAALELTETMDVAATALGDYDVDDAALDAMAVSDIRICEDGIAAAVNEVDAKRKELTRMLTAPKKLVDEKCKELTEPLKALGLRYRDARESIYLKGYEAQYTECCVANGMEGLLDAVPFDAFMAMNPRWLTRTANPVKTQEKIADEVGRIAKDWRTLQSMRGSMRFYDDAEIEFFKTLDLKSAIERNGQRTAEQERIDAMNREREENERWRRERAMQADADEIESFNRAIVEQQLNAYAPAFEAVEPEQEQPAGTARNAYADEQAHMRELVAEHVADGHPNRRRYHFEAWLDDAELASFREWKNACGIGTGWTFKEVRNA